MRTFTLPEAQRLLPIVDALLKRAQQAAAVVLESEKTMERLSTAIHLSGGMRVDLLEVSRQRGEHVKAAQRASETMTEIEAVGVEVRSLATGLVEFPFQLEDQVVMLCWAQGENTISRWRPQDAEDAEPRPLDGRFLHGERPQ